MPILIARRGRKKEINLKVQFQNKSRSDLEQGSATYSIQSKPSLLPVFVNKVCFFFFFFEYYNSQSFMCCLLWTELYFPILTLSRVKSHVEVLTSDSIGDRALRR